MGFEGKPENENNDSAIREVMKNYAILDAEERDIRDGRKKSRGRLSEIKYRKLLLYENLSKLGYRKDWPAFGSDIDTIIKEEGLLAHLDTIKGSEATKKLLERLRDLGIKQGKIQERGSVRARKDEIEWEKIMGEKNKIIGKLMRSGFNTPKEIFDAVSGLTSS